MSTGRSIEIIGGGLAGLSLGYALRHAGVDVDILEAGEYPRHRVCGEFIAGLDPSTIRHLGLEAFLEGALRHEEVAWHTGDGSVLYQRLPSPALGISRLRLDHRIAAAYVKAGGRLHTQTRATEFEDRPGRVIATGRKRGKSSWVGLKVHALGLPLVRDLELHLGNGAYVGLSRVENNRVNICGLFHKGSGRLLLSEPTPFPKNNNKRPDPLCTFLRGAGMDALARRIEAADTDPESVCAVAGLRFDGSVRRSAGVQLGDAAAMIPPFTGNGMAMAFQSAEAALDPLIGYSRGSASWAATVREIRARLGRRFRLRLASAGALHPWLLRPSRHRLLAAAGKRSLIPFRPLYALLH